MIRDSRSRDNESGLYLHIGRRYQKHFFSTESDCCSLETYMILTIFIDWSRLCSDKRIIESMTRLRPGQGNLRLVFRLFSLMRGLPQYHN